MSFWASPDENVSGNELAEDRRKDLAVFRKFFSTLNKKSTSLREVHVSVFWQGWAKVVKVNTIYDSIVDFLFFLFWFVRILGGSCDNKWIVEQETGDESIGKADDDVTSPMQIDNDDENGTKRCIYKYT